MKKRIINFLFLVLMTVSLVYVGAVTVFAADEFTVSVSSEKVKKGTDTVTLDVMLKNNPGIAGVTMNLEFDNSAFAVKSVTEGDFSSLTLVRGEGTQSPYKMILVNFAGANVTGDGKLVSVTFDIMDSVQPGTYEVLIKCNHEQEDLFFIDQTGEHIDNNAVSGIVTIASGNTAIGTGVVDDGKEEEVVDDGERKDEEDIFEEKWINPFFDVKEEQWFYPSVEYVVKQGLFKGVSETEFAPETPVTRAMLVTVLYRAEGEPQVQWEANFEDVPNEAYYSKAVDWGKECGIINGISETEFAPDALITREQVATILFRYAIYKGMDFVTLEENLHFDDAHMISEYAVSAMNWAVGKGLMNGRTENTISPQDNATRAEVATILTRYFTEIAK